LLGSGNDSYIGRGGGIVTGSIQGGDGNDTFIAGRSRDVFFGGTGADSFVFNSTAFSPAGAKRDIIGDFHHAEHDRIDVHLIDADRTHAGHQAFRFIGGDTFAHYHSLHPHVVGMLRFDARTHHLQGNVDAHLATAEFDVVLHGFTAMSASDFVLV
jgi:Ca2+-binding RTX toxin-like protein